MRKAGQPHGGFCSEYNSAHRAISIKNDIVYSCAETVHVPPASELAK